MVLWTAVQSVLSIVLLIAIGFMLRRKGWFHDGFAGDISRFIMNIALPASIFISVLTYLKPKALGALSEGIIYGALAFAVTYLLAWAAVKIFKVPQGRRGVFINTWVNGNTIFIGLPLNVALFGQVSMPYFLVYYLLNTLSTWTLGVYLISSDRPAEQREKEGFNWKKLFSAPLLGFLVALIFLETQWTLPDFLHSSLSYLGATVTPLALIYIGINLCDAGLKSVRLDKDTLLALIGKFIIAPALIFAFIELGKLWFPLPRLESQTLIMQAAVSALAILPILANEAKGDVRYATNIVTTSTLLFMIVAPLLDMLLQGF